VRSELLRHGFDARVPARLDSARPPDILCSFIGQLAGSYHGEREKLLETLVRAVPTTVFLYPPSRPSELVYWTRKAAFLGKTAARSLGLPLWPPALARLQDPAAQWPRRRWLALATRKSPVYGLALYQAMRDSQVAFNSHAAISPRSASNMRLYEATGAGACLLTDWREDLATLFDLDRQVVAYRSAAECAEKARWLLDHPAQAAAIAAAGQARTLADHTLARRAHDFDRLLRAALAGLGSRAAGAAAAAAAAGAGASGPAVDSTPALRTVGGPGDARA
jgi:hypothetical protein